MATRELIQRIEVGASGANSIDFINIPQEFTDLIIVASSRASAGAQVRNMNIRFNGSTSGYSERMIDSDGSGTSSANTSGSLINWATENDSASTAGTFSNVSITIPNYSGNGYKSATIDSVTENNATYGVLRLTSGLWSNNSPINMVSLLPEAGSSFVQYSSAVLYGIRKGSNGLVNYPATGGTITTSNGYTYHTFTSSGIFTVGKQLNADILVVAGGGGSGGNFGGGGGAGGYVATSATLMLGSQTLITVGAGSAGDASTPASNSSIFSYIAYGGGTGYGGVAGGGGPAIGQLGGSGAGGGGVNGASNTSPWLGGTPLAGQGNTGSNGTYNRAGGAGGGASSAASGQTGGAGTAWLNGTYYAGGGGGGGLSGYSNAGTGGIGGGGAGANTGSYGVAGTANTGGGAGGGPGNGYGTNGGSGIVIIRYPTP